MKITIEAEHQEMAALVLAIQERQIISKVTERPEDVIRAIIQDIREANCDMHQEKKEGKYGRPER